MFIIALRYFSLLVCVVVFFVNFISCGLQFYKVSLEDDVQQELPYDATDPDSEFYGIHATAGWRQLPITFSGWLWLRQHLQPHLEGTAARHLAGDQDVGNGSGQAVV